MPARTLHTDGQQRTVAIVLSTGDEAIACLKAFAEREHVTAAQFTAIGPFAGATWGLAFTSAAATWRRPTALRAR
jgi:predicted DNA-binding protein with PD1-like motif